MIKIENKEYKQYSTSITWETFSAGSLEKRRSGLAPFITFQVENKYIGLEFSYAKKMFEKIKPNQSVNVKEYISDILYEDENGWISLLGNYDCRITRINHNVFNIKFDIEAAEISIQIDTNIELLV